jgi:N-acetyl-gamma-glutamyl-phosphate reductase
MPYNFYKHRHPPEIIQELNKASDGSVKITFSPHILSVYRGILETIYVNLNQDIKLKDIIEIYNEFYSNENFVKLKNSDFIEIKDAINTNNVLLSLHINDNKLTILSVIDNLMKGAAGQAIQNMNVMMNYVETTALEDE